MLNSNIFDQDIICCVCLQKFDNLTHKPYMLQCGHNLCDKAINRILGIDDSFLPEEFEIQCPLCKSTNTYWQKLPQNFMVNSIIEKISIIDDSRLIEPINQKLMNKSIAIGTTIKEIQSDMNSYKEQLVKDEQFVYFEQGQSQQRLEDKRVKFVKSKYAEVDQITEIGDLLISIKIKLSKLKQTNQFQVNYQSKPLIKNSPKKSSQKFKKRSEYTDKEFIEQDKKFRKRSEYTDKEFIEQEEEKQQYLPVLDIFTLDNINENSDAREQVIEEPQQQLNLFQMYDKDIVNIFPNEEEKQEEVPKSYSQTQRVEKEEEESDSNTENAVRSQKIQKNICGSHYYRHVQEKEQNDSTQSQKNLNHSRTIPHTVRQSVVQKQETAQQQQQEEILSQKNADEIPKDE